MKAPTRIQPLIDDGLVDEVLGSLMSGKEAQVYLVRCGPEIRCAKVYKDVAVRSFKQAVQYQEGRKVRNSRRQRAMERRSKFGRDQQRRFGKVPKSTRYTSSPKPEYASPRHTVALMVYC